MMKLHINVYAQCIIALYYDTMNGCWEALSKAGQQLFVGHLPMNW